MKIVVGAAAAILATASVATASGPVGSASPVAPDFQSASTYFEEYNARSGNIITQGDRASDVWWATDNARRERTAIRNQRKAARKYKVLYEALVRDTAALGECRVDLLGQQRRTWRTLVNRANAQQSLGLRAIARAERQVGFQAASTLTLTFQTLLCLASNGWTLPSEPS